MDVQWDSIVKLRYEEEYPFCMADFTGCTDGYFCYNKNFHNKIGTAVVSIVAGIDSCHVCWHIVLSCTSLK